jgi:hypothetical protein
MDSRHPEMRIFSEYFFYTVRLALSPSYAQRLREAAIFERPPKGDIKEISHAYQTRI